MPLTPSGKVNRKALPEVDLSTSALNVEYVAPVTEQETALAAVSAQVLGLEKVGVLDNFFDLGGDSLKAIELTAVLEQAGFHAEVKDVFETENLKELAAKLAFSQIETSEDIPTGDIPATPAQMRVYTAQSISGGTAYNVPYIFKVSQLDPSRLQAAVDRMVARYEIFRIKFENLDGQIMQMTDDSAACVVEGLSSDDISAFIRPFDLSKAPLLRVGYYENTVLIDMHHIITDGGSMPVFLRELNELYMGRELTVPPVQYREFAAQKQDLSEDESYWLNVFTDEPPVLEMNTDYPRQNKQRFEGAAIYDSIPIALHEKICAKSRELGVTPYVFYMGAFHVLLSKFSGNEDIVVGTPASGRSGKFLNALGMFVNTLALRSRPEGEKTVREFLHEMKTAAVDALAHQNYPYGELVKKLGIHTESRNPLFDVMFAYQSEEMTQVVFGDAPAELLPVPVTTSKYDFTFNVMPRREDVVLMVEYCTALFKDATIRRLIAGYKLLLEQMLDESKLLKNLTVMTEQERGKLLYDFNDTAANYPRDKCVHTLFEEQAERTPDKTAVIACDRTLTYAELNEEANRIAHGLIEKGVQPGDIVAFALPRDSHLIPTMFGILKAGAAYLPIDPDYPQERISYILQDSGAKAFVTEEELPALLAEENAQNPGLDLSSENLCYCIYTSGSTGEPKGTLLMHRGIVNLVAHLEIYDNLSRCERFGFSTTITFDVATQEILTALLNGFTGILLPERRETPLNEITTLIQRQKIDVIYATPTYFDSLTSDMSQAQQLFSTLKVVCLAGETFSLNANVLSLRESSDIIFENQYGPVELHVIAVAATQQGGDFSSIGKPIKNNKAYIVDRFMNPVPVGVTGELCIAGDGVGAGYLNRPELTAEKFIDNPFGPGRLYKTGDLAYWREDGNIVYVGRNDFQVKIRGLRIELGEIETAISGVEGIAQAVVVVRKDETGRQLICAFYTGVEQDAKAIRAAIGTKLPKYMLPHIFTHLGSMPLTPSGKVNRKALPEVDLNSLSPALEYIAPVGEVEKHLAALMEQVLDYSPVGRDDDFFDLGGDSLKVIEFVSVAHTEGLYFALQNVFDYPTVRMLREYMESGDKPAVSYDDVDFAAVNDVLAKNCEEILHIPGKQEVGNLFLTGATGFLGIHLLADYLEHDSGTAYCLVRGQSQADSEKRLAKLLDFYFGEKYAALLGGRIQVVCGDLQKDNLGVATEEYQKLKKCVDTVINAAASVKHYGSYQYFYEVNVESTQRLIDFCLSAKAMLIHISTLSVSGNGFDTFDGYVSETEKHFYESNLYIGQPLDNVYARSKFEAERLVLEAVSKGLNACVMRMGNLSNRQSDGVFQINYQTNAAAQRVKGLIELRLVPDYLLEENMYVEFTPVDEAAQAVMLLTRHFDAKRTVFHINSTKVVYLDKLMEFFTVLGYPIRAVPGAEFTAALRETAKQAGMEYIFETFIHDLDEQDRLSYDSNIRIENSLTEEYLHRLGFDWGDIGLEYLRKYVEYFKRIGFFVKIEEQNTNQSGKEKK